MRSFAPVVDAEGIREMASPQTRILQEQDHQRHHGSNDTGGQADSSSTSLQTVQLLSADEECLDNYESVGPRISSSTGKIHPRVRIDLTMPPEFHPRISSNDESEPSTSKDLQEQPRDQTDRCIRWAPDDIVNHGSHQLEAPPTQIERLQNLFSNRAHWTDCSRRKPTLKKALVQVVALATLGIGISLIFTGVYRVEGGRNSDTAHVLYGVGSVFFLLSLAIARFGCGKETSTDIAFPIPRLREYGSTRVARANKEWGFAASQEIDDDNMETDEEYFNVEDVGEHEDDLSSLSSMSHVI